MSGNRSTDISRVLANIEGVDLRGPLFGSWGHWIIINT